MPYKSDKSPIGKNKDNRRIKLFIDDKIYIRGLYAEGIPIRQIVKKYYPSVSRRTIQFVLFPERKLKAAEQRKNNGRLFNNYYQKDRHRNYMKKHRKHKHEVFIERGRE